MWTLKLPRHSARDTFATCISGISDDQLRQHFQNAAEIIVNESATYAEAAARHALHEIIPKDIVAPNINTDKMKKLYNQWMVGKTAPGRAIYDEIRVSSPQGRCPLCAHRQVMTLDHVLPKMHYPVFAVTPSNLVPACSDCNKAKLASLPQRAEEVALHPYYDDLGGEKWLFADVVGTQPAALRFTIVPPDGWDNILADRVMNHFSTLKLGALYASEAAEELVNIRHQLLDIYNTGGLHEVRDELQQRAHSCDRGRLNGWRSATYHAWAENDWFCNGGFGPT
ncbi:MAG: hypothetical protein H7839_22610 [Magnetococcus sp. YQC-5]